MPEESASIASTNGDKSKRTGRGVWLGGLIVLGFVVVGAFVWWSLRSTNAADRATEVPFPLETFVINLEGSGPRAYLRVGITLGLVHPVSARSGEQPPVALIRDTILAVLATGQPEQLLKAEGKRQLKDQLLKALQERAPELGVENVYFTEFLVQM